VSEAGEGSASGAATNYPSPGSRSLSRTRATLSRKGRGLAQPPRQSTPPRRKVRVVGRQAQDGMQMVRQHDDRRHGKGISLLRFRKCAAQCADMIDEQGLPPIEQVVREEPASVGHKGAAIIRHGQRVTRLPRSMPTAALPVGRNSEAYSAAPARTNGGLRCANLICPTRLLIVIAGIKSVCDGVRP
jgi:hypothetical protein